MGLLIGSIIGYNVSLADLGTEILTQITNVSPSNQLRTIMLCIFTASIIPLCMIPKIQSLAKMSACAMLFYSLMIMHMILVLGVPKIFTHFPLAQMNWWRPAGLLHCTPIFLASIFCQTQLHTIYAGLYQPSVVAMRDLVRIVVIIIAFAYGLFGFFGYVAFFDSDSLPGNVFLIYPKNALSFCAQAGFLFTITVSIPLVLFPLRQSVESFFFHRSHSMMTDVEAGEDTSVPVRRFRSVTICLLIVCLLLSLTTNKIELIIQLTSSLAGSLIGYILPGLVAMYAFSHFKISRERRVGTFILCVGLFLLLSGLFAVHHTPATSHVDVDSGVRSPPLSSIQPPEVVIPRVQMVPSDDRQKGAFPIVERVIQQKPMVDVNPPIPVAPNVAVDPLQPVAAVNPPVQVVPDGAVNPPIPVAPNVAVDPLQPVAAVNPPVQVVPNAAVNAPIPVVPNVAVNAPIPVVPNVAVNPPQPVAAVNPPVQVVPNAAMNAPISVVPNVAVNPPQPVAAVNPPVQVVPNAAVNAPIPVVPNVAVNPPQPVAAVNPPVQVVPNAAVNAPIPVVQNVAVNPPQPVEVVNPPVQIVPNAAVNAPIPVVPNVVVNPPQPVAAVNPPVQVVPNAAVNAPIPVVQNVAVNPPQPVEAVNPPVQIVPNAAVNAPIPVVPNVAVNPPQPVAVVNPPVQVVPNAAVNAPIPVVPNVAINPPQPVAAVNPPVQVVPNAAVNAPIPVAPNMAVNPPQPVAAVNPPVQVVPNVAMNPVEANSVEKGPAVEVEVGQAKRPVSMKSRSRPNIAVALDSPPNVQNANRQAEADSVDMSAVKKPVERDADVPQPVKVVEQVVPKAAIEQPPLGERPNAPKHLLPVESIQPLAPIENQQPLRNNAPPVIPKHASKSKLMPVEPQEQRVAAAAVAEVAQPEEIMHANANVHPPVVKKEPFREARIEA